MRDGELGLRVILSVSPSHPQDQNSNSYRLVIFLRMAAVEALADKKYSSVIALASELSETLPTEQPERAVMLESLMED